MHECSGLRRSWRRRREWPVGEERRAETGSHHGEHGVVAGGAEDDSRVDGVGRECSLERRLCAVRRPADYRRAVEFGKVDGAIRKAPTRCHEAVRVVEEFDVFDIAVVGAEVVEEQVDGGRVRKVHLVLGMPYVAAGELVPEPANQDREKIRRT